MQPVGEGEKMITDKDRSYYIGASDTKYVMSNWDTQTFRNWWDVKMGFAENDIENIYLQTGNMYEPKILDHLGVTQRDRQIIIGRLRVNLDGEKDDAVIEVKTVGKDITKWKPPRIYHYQIQVELFASQKNYARLVAYQVNAEDYEAVALGRTLPIDESRIDEWDVYFDEEWIDDEYLPRLWYLADCLEEERLPCMDDWLKMRRS